MSYFNEKKTEIGEMKYFYYMYHWIILPYKPSVDWALFKSLQQAVITEVLVLGYLVCLGFGSFCSWYLKRSLRSIVYVLI